MPGEEKVFGNEIGFTIKEIGDRVYQRYQAMRRVERHQADRYHPQQGKGDKAVQAYQEHHRVAQATECQQEGGAPDTDEYGNGNIDRPDMIYYKIFQYMTLSLLDMLEEIGEYKKNERKDQGNDDQLDFKPVFFYSGPPGYDLTGIFLDKRQHAVHRYLQYQA